jgi:hypothetical protein
MMEAIEDMDAVRPASAAGSGESPEEGEITGARIGLLVLYIASAAIYFPWRLTVFNPQAPVFSALFFGIEAAGFVWGSSTWQAC